MLLSDMQNTTFGDEFNQCIKNVTLASVIQIITVGREFNHRAACQASRFGQMFSQRRMNNVTLASVIQIITVGGEFNDRAACRASPSDDVQLEYEERDAARRR